MEELFIGIDIGGMSIKGALVNRKGEILREGVIETGARDGGKSLLNNVLSLATELSDSRVVGVGIGSPGIIDSQNGVIVFAGNLALKNYPLAKNVENTLKLPVKLTNDANAAALGEAKFGAAQNFKDSILVTLGTGVGGGIVIDGKLFEGGKSAGAEIGHMVIEKGGYPCTCGRRGCFECYASATALMRRTREAMESDKKSAMWKSYTPETVSGKTAFEYAESDKSAREVVDWYIDHLACGIANLVNAFRPQTVMLGGGVSGQGRALCDPLQKKVDGEIFAGNDYAPVKIACAALGSKAGALGAAALFM